MLRLLFGQSKRKDEGELLDAMNEINRFVRLLEEVKATRRQPAEKLSHYAIWGLGFLDSLDELEQSCFCSVSYASRVSGLYVEDMKEPERDDYRRFVYFYKNGFIRVFSTLDKLGYFLNEWMGLQTEKVKEHFSYFTVLRNMHEHGVHPALQQQLYELKSAYKVQLASMRKQRNMEIHYMNAELLDDWKKSSYLPGDKISVENVRAQAKELSECCRMVILTLRTVFAYLNERMGERV